MLEILQQIPFQYWKLAKSEFRRRFATVEWPEYPDHLHLEIDVDVLEEQLRRHHFEDANGWSLKYEDEILNMRRPAGTAVDGRPLEDHLRARPVDGDLEINGHVEPNRWEAKTAHVHEEGLTWLDKHELRILLEGCGIDVDTLEP
ncbi:hypothetical protein [Natronobacterium gregoryi]|uniref:Uncharacterized protein n=2 Tax=Natronobacterium gregoryi TaxID=44930 RepID=L0AL65_NATGS|nr:hypothetical protein [Natronobacterium gregoryi]AFZ74541.1 hypothetical protein Natgr_3422 [Natronobacterium gregoryi SP2]ELY72387.1 hypothetical protein C490_03548 [Natronobacterium gregoryi SP2]PLK21715.1 hypothetical protein CYV19_02440 [Natronobacterium gregoryi SP2]SFI96756.1 hypothetical protein SAMN05443661_110164 [Natronobacterium gregoryi]